MKSYAQAGQDVWVHDLIGDTGFFVDVGAHDGIVHSNTYALEQAGWKGICIEAQEGTGLWGNRSANSWIVLHAIMDREGFVDMAGDVVVDRDGHQIYCNTLAHAIERSPYSDRPVIDYLSIDVEGCELEVLAGMDFDRWHVRCATIEHNAYCDGPTRKHAIAEIMFAHGFERVREDVVAEGYGPYEDWWIHRDG